MIQLTMSEVNQVNGGFKFHVNIFQAVMTVVGAGILGGPVGLGVAIGAAIGAQGLGQLHEMYTDEYGQVHQK